MAEPARSSTSTLEVHHLLDDALRGLRDLGFFAGQVCAVLTELLFLAKDVHGDQLVDVLAARFTLRHGPSLPELASGQHVQPVRMAPRWGGVFRAFRGGHSGC